MTVVNPTIDVLNPEQIEKVHRYAIDILANIGVHVEWPEARERLAEKGCRVEENNRVFFPEELILWSIAAAPDTVTVYDSSGKTAFVVGGDGDRQTRFGLGVTNLYYQDPLTDALSPFSLEHVAKAVGLAHRLTHFDLVSTPGIARDQDPRTADLKVTLEMIANTTKPLVLLVSEHKLFDPVLDLVAHLKPDCREKPFAVPYVNPITPLVLNTETLEKMASAIRRGLPIIYNNYGMSGATAPITPGGTLALLTAELLAGLAFAQTLEPGTPVLLGSLPAGFDMGQMTSIYTPHTVLLNLACAEMMTYYRLPHSGTSGSGPGWGPDLMAGGAFWMNHLTACMGKVGLAPFVGGNLDSMAFSPASVVYADEVIRQARMFAAGFELTDTEVAMEEIAAIGPGGNFLEADSTFERFRDLSHDSAIWPNVSADQWQNTGNPKAATRLREYTHDLMADPATPEDRDRIMAEGTRFIEGMLGE